MVRETAKQGLRLIRGFLLVSAFCFSISAQQVDYLIQVDIDRDLFVVTMDVPALDLDSASFLVPAWAPGNYRMINFGRWVNNVSALSKDGTPLPVVRLGPNEWRIRDAGSLSKLTYTVADIPEDSVETLPTSLNELNEATFYFNGPTMYGYFESQKRLPQIVRFEVPAGWRVFCALPGDSLSFRARSYDELADSPVLGGDNHLSVSSFEAKGITYRFVVSSPRVVSPDSLIAVTRPVVLYQHQLFSTVPFNEYLFLMVFSRRGSRFGALEHTSSSAYYLPPPGSMRDIRLSFYSRVIAHEAFHAWIPKRIHPKILEAPPYQDSIRLSTMWFLEGFTEYYAKLSLVRSGVLPADYFYGEVRALALGSLEDNLEMQSLRAAELGVTQAMYNKGALVGLLMDIEIRRKTKNKKSLDDVLVYLWKNKRVYEENSFATLVKKATGADIRSILKDFVQSDQFRPIEPFLRAAGLRYEFLYRPFLGWSLDVDDDGNLYVVTSTAGSTSDALNIESGDIMVEVQDRRVGSDMDQIREAVRLVESLAVGDSIRIVIRRNGRSIERKGTIQRHPTPDIRVVEDEKAGKLERSILDGLLGR